MAEETYSKSVLGTSKNEPTGSSTESGSVGTSKRKHDGSSDELEPKTKIATNNESGTSFAASSSDRGNITTNRGSLTEMFKCDYCLKTAKDKHQMHSHLVNDVHSSASTVLIDQQDNIVYLKETRAVKLEDARYKNVAAACQSCRLLFDTIFMCEDHNARSHKTDEGFYHLVDIVERVLIKVAVSENICSTCSQSFRKSKQLTRHYKQSNHFPFNERSDCDVFTLCCYCNKTFSSFKVASGHVKGHQKMAKNGMLDLIIVYVDKSSRKFTVPPYQPDKEAEVKGIRTKIADLQDLSRIGGRSGRSEIQKEIRVLKHSL